MKPTRAAWFMVVGLAWLVLRGILGRTVPIFDPQHVAQQGGVLLLIPMMSVIASFTLPLFFFSFRRFHLFEGQRTLRVATSLAVAASVASFALVVFSFVGLVGSRNPSAGWRDSIGWASNVVPLFLITAIFFFLVVFARQYRGDAELRRAAAAAAVGAVYPALLMTASLLYLRLPELMNWFPGFSRSVAARILGLVAAAALLWFLETFARAYDGEKFGEQRS